ncbi:MAG: glycosyltransferase family 4 protein [Chloroflexota bacterium]|nr:glycosyltransferase family 4 protein [Chloroflexota bacterium]
MSHVVIDMTPLEPGGLNGGAGLVAVSLARYLPRLAPEMRWTLLTSHCTHAELASLDASNLQRLCVIPAARPGQRLRARGRAALRAVLPAVAAAHIGELLSRFRSRKVLLPQLESLGADLLFCPFTIAYFWNPGTPMVSTVHDLQELTYPQFFTPEQRLNRNRQIREACARAARIVCVSEYVRGTLLANVGVAPARVRTIRLGLLHELNDPGAQDRHGLEALGLRPAHFLLYPANFWPHKNHRTLFEALLRYRARRPRSDLQLVCTGAANAAMRSLQSDAPAGVVFTGYAPSADMHWLVRSCAAIIFPSLYEGFGLPAVEAMACGKPILCSSVTSLPEVVGDAGLYFDPTDPDQIADAIVRLEDEPAQVAEMVSRGHTRAADLGTGRDVAGRYLELFQEVLAERGA